MAQCLVCGQSLWGGEDGFKTSHPSPYIEWLACQSLEKTLSESLLTYLEDSINLCTCVSNWRQVYKRVKWRNDDKP